MRLLTFYQVVKLQEELDLDVLVHGEPERNDMVQYFGGMPSPCNIR